MLTGYVYNTDTMVVVAKITGTTRGVEGYVYDNYDDDIYGLTFSPAFGFVGGLIETDDAVIIDIDE